MSSLPMKIDSRYIHLRCTSIQISITSAMSDSFFSHDWTSCRNGLTNLDPSMDCKVRAMSSITSVISSTVFNTLPLSTSPLTYRISSNF